MQEARARRHASSSSMPATPIPLQSDQIPHLQPTAKRLAQPPSQVPNTPTDVVQPSVSTTTVIAAPPGLPGAPQIVLPPGDTGVLPPEPLVLIRNHKLGSDQTNIINDLKRAVATRLDVGANMTIQTGPRLRILQDMFGTPHNRTVLAATWVRRPV